MSEAAPTVIAELKDIQNYDIDKFDILGFGSGIYAGKINKNMTKFIKSSVHNKKVFLFTTSGTGNYEKYNAATVKLLESNNNTVLGNFGCKGLCKWFIFALVGGIAKNHPDIDDFDAAQTFIEGVVENYSKTI